MNDFEHVSIVSEEKFSVTQNFRANLVGNLTFKISNKKSFTVIIFQIEKVLRPFS